MAWGDYDNDGDLDLLVCGSTSNNLLTRIYRNDGQGTLVDIHAGLIPLVARAVAWGDYDNDGDLGILLNGVSDIGFRTTAIYRNEGGGVFFRLSTPLPELVGSVAVWFDHDNDGERDLLVTGEDQNNIKRVGL